MHRLAVQIAAFYQDVGTVESRVDLVLDAGPAIGLGATTVDITEPYWRVIKQGVIPESSIAEVLKGS
jgi:L-threonylcarbamoyladenylate synthase